MLPAQKLVLSSHWVQALLLYHYTSCTFLDWRYEHQYTLPLSLYHFPGCTFPDCRFIKFPSMFAAAICFRGWID
ncbi:hypothetical protein CY35_09G032800 [Sphagnum magellanicum]|nr:hypothetical protein CY35_09G032800 [Sphagnum magellanicum]